MAWDCKLRVCVESDPAELKYIDEGHVMWFKIGEGASLKAVRGRYPHNLLLTTYSFSRLSYKIKSIIRPEPVIRDQIRSHPDNSFLESTQCRRSDPRSGRVARWHHLLALSAHHLPIRLRESSSPAAWLRSQSSRLHLLVKNWSDIRLEHPMVPRTIVRQAGSVFRASRKVLPASVSWVFPKGR